MSFEFDSCAHHDKNAIGKKGKGKPPHKIHLLIPRSSDKEKLQTLVLITPLSVLESQLLLKLLENGDLNLSSSDILYSFCRRLLSVRDYA